MMMNTNTHLSSSVPYLCLSPDFLFPSQCLLPWISSPPAKKSRNESAHLGVLEVPFSKNDLFRLKKTTGIGSKLQGTNISPLKVAGKMIFLFHRWDMLVPRRVFVYCTHSKCFHLCFFADFLRDLSYQNAWEFLKLETGSVATPAEHGLVGWPKVTQDVTGRNICNHVPKNMIIVTIKPGALDISQPLFTRPKKIPSTYTAKV